MLLLSDREKEIASSEITPQATFEAFQMNRRRLMAGMGAMGLAAALPRAARAEQKIDGLVTTQYAVPDRDITPEAKAKSYNNFYEFGEDKGDPAKNAYKLEDVSVGCEGGGAGGQATDVPVWRAISPSADGVAGVSFPLRGGLVDGGFRGDGYSSIGVDQGSGAAAEG